MIRLGVNIDHVATLRQARLGREPDPVAAAILAVLGGADGITMHLREDRRHIQERDLPRMKDAVHVRLNFELAAYDEIVRIAADLKPEEATLVPEKREELTTEGGLDVLANADSVGEAVRRLKGEGIHVALFIDPSLEQIDMSRDLGADAVEFQTAAYSEATTPAAVAAELAKLHAAAAYASQAGLHVHLGHGLNYQNVHAVCRIPGVEELNIGHGIVSRAVLVGMTQAVADMKRAIAGA